MTIEQLDSITSTVKHYDDLAGASGKSARYRARRFTVDSLFPNAKPSLYIRQTHYPLIDLSASGLAFSKRADLPRFDVNSDIDLAIAYKDITLFESKATVVREEQSAHSAKIAVHLDGSHLDIGELQRRYEQAILVDRLKGIENTQQYIAAIPSDYRALCDEVVYLVSEYREVLEDFTSSTAAAMLPTSEALILKPWQDILRRGNALIDEHQTMASLNRFEMRNLKKSLKQYTEKFVTPHFLDAPVWARSYYKPLGYPGDFQVMKYVYDQGREGETLYAQLMHFLGVEMGAFVRNRMQFTRDLIQTLIQENDDQIRITNVGCGMAYEVSSLLGSADFIDKRVHFTLVDQDDRALEPAYLQRIATQSGTKANSCF